MLWDCIWRLYELVWHSINVSIIADYKCTTFCWLLLYLTMLQQVLDFVLYFLYWIKQAWRPNTITCRGLYFAVQWKLSKRDILSCVIRWIGFLLLQKASVIRECFSATCSRISQQSAVSSIVLLPIKFNPNVNLVGWLVCNPVEIVLISTAFTKFYPVFYINFERGLKISVSVHEL